RAVGGSPRPPGPTASCRAKRAACLLPRAPCPRRGLLGELTAEAGVARRIEQLVDVGSAEAAANPFVLDEQVAERLTGRGGGLGSVIDGVVSALASDLATQREH